MINIKKEDAVIRDRVTACAFLLQSAIFFSAQFAPIIDDSVFTFPHVLFKTAAIDTMHLSIGIVGVIEQPVYSLLDTDIALGIDSFDMIEFFTEEIGWFKEKGPIIHVFYSQGID